MKIGNKLMRYIVSCHRKVRYGHEVTALKAASDMNKKTGNVFEAYACKFCKGWHIGKPKGEHSTVRFTVHFGA